METCPICLVDKKLEKICDNNHYACKVCMILSVINKQYYCPICRNNINIERFQLNNLNVPFDFNKKKIYFRINDGSPWKHYDILTSKKILIDINYSIALDKYYGVSKLNDNINIYWGKLVNKNILHKKKEKLYKKHITELSRWKGLYKNIIVEYNTNNYTLKLCAII